MQTTTLLLVLAVITVAAFSLGRKRALDSVGGPGRISHLHSLPGYYGYLDFYRTSPDFELARAGVA